MMILELQLLIGVATCILTFFAGYYLAKLTHERQIIDLKSELGWYRLNYAAKEQDIDRLSAKLDGHLENLQTGKTSGQA